MQATELSLDPISVWQGAPPERSAAFSAALGAVSRAMQQALRDHVPARYFLTTERYCDPRRALPMLVYQCSRPAPHRQSREFTYDVLSSRMMTSFFWTVRQKMPAELRRLEMKLLAEGNLALARTYAPRHVGRIVAWAHAHRRLLDRLLSTEASLVNDLINFAVAVRQARRPESHHLKLIHVWRRTLSRIYPGLDASGFAIDLFHLATQTLATFAPLSDPPAESTAGLFIVKAA